VFDGRVDRDDHGRVGRDEQHGGQHGRVPHRARPVQRGHRRQPAGGGDHLPHRHRGGIGCVQRLDGGPVGSNVRKIPVYLADGNTEWLGWCKGNGVIESTMIGQQKAIIFDSTLHTFFIDSTNSTAALMAVTITDVPDYSLGSTNGPVVFRFLSSMASPVIK
jgi:hypothetical protein